MKKYFTAILLFFSMIMLSQQIPMGNNQRSRPNEQLAQNYFDRGEFDKAILIYEDLVKEQPYNYIYFQKQIDCYQQLKQFEKAENVIKNRIERTKQANLYVDFGFNYQLQKETDKATKNYKIALEKIKENPNNVYLIARSFEEKSLINEAIEAYNLGAQVNENANFDYQVALLQGQLGKMDLMIEKLIDYAYKYPSNLALVQNQLTRFMDQEGESSFSSLLKKSLLLRTQKTQDIFWNQFMSWFFLQLKDYDKAFIQEKAIYKRNPDNFSNIVNLAKFAIEEKESETARNILNFILENTQDQELILEVQYQLVNLDINKATQKEYPAIENKITALLQQFGTTSNTVKLQILQAHFYSFYLNQFPKAIGILNNALKLPLNNYQKADIKMELADVLLLDQKFNQSIIYYAQIEEDLKNDEVAHEASFKMARASYFKGDFEWALSQFKVLKSSTSQLIANDSMELFLLINDNKEEDSTHVALKKFAKADFLIYQNKNDIAIQAFKKILEEHKGQSIEAITLLKIGQLNEKLNDYQQALTNYQMIIDKHPDCIYVDEALFFSAEIYNKQLHDIEKAKENYEKIIFKHEDSIFFIEARKSFRKLRGDANL
jgi:tetratricopeptide (TPR) repeat protein